MRKLWMIGPERKEALRLCKVAPATWQCEDCGAFTREPEVDHVVPVGPTPGSRNADAAATWDGWLSRLFCDPSGLDVLCPPCHVRKGARDRAKDTPGG